MFSIDKQKGPDLQVYLILRPLRAGAEWYSLHYRLLAWELQELQLLRPLPGHHGLHDPHLRHVSRVPDKIRLIVQF